MQSSSRSGLRSRRARQSWAKVSTRFLVVRLQRRNEFGPAVFVPNAVGQEGNVAQTNVVHQRPREFDHLSVNRRISVADGLYAKLVVLAKPAGLRTLVAEHRAQVIQPHRLRLIVHPVLQIGPAHWSRSLGAQCELVAAPILKDVHLFFDDVRAFAHAAHKQSRVLKHGAVDAAVPEPTGHVNGLALNVTPVFLFRRQTVGGAAGSLKSGHTQSWSLLYSVIGN